MEGFPVQHIPSQEYGITKFQDVSSIDEFEGQVIITVIPQQGPVPHGKSPTPSLRFVCSLFGVVRQLVLLRIDDPAMYVYRIEFDSVDAANRAVGALIDPFGVTEV